MKLPVGEIQSFFSDSDLHVFISEDFASAKDDYREKLRKHIIEKLGVENLSTHEISELQNLESPPRLNDTQISISHCHIAGGFVSSKGDNFSLGFDLEEISRINKAIVERVCSEADVTVVPELTSLWGVKESSFKAVSNRDSAPIKTISEINVLTAETVSSRKYSGFSALSFSCEFRAENQRWPVDGLQLIKDELQISIARSFSSTLAKDKPNE